MPPLDLVSRLIDCFLFGLKIQIHASRFCALRTRHPAIRVSIVNLLKVKWLGNPLLSVFVRFFGPERAQRSIAFLSF